MYRELILGAFLLSAAGCAGDMPASVSGGECRVFVPPQAKICGLTLSDQKWIDENVESGIASCGWERKPGATCVRPIHKTTPIPKPKPKHHYWQSKPS